MKTKFKLLSLLALVLCLIMAVALFATACNDDNSNTEGTEQEEEGPGPKGDGDDEQGSGGPGIFAPADFEVVGLTYSDINSHRVGDWDGKTLSYQFYGTVNVYDSYAAITDDSNHPAAQVGEDTGIDAAVLLNLYEDGSAALFQMELFEYEGNAPKWLSDGWWNSANYISYVSYGTWAQVEGMMNSVGLKVNLVTVLADSSVTVQETTSSNDKWAESIDGCYVIELSGKSEDGVNTFSYKWGKNAQLPLVLLCGNKATGFVNDGEVSSFTEGSDVEYSKIQEWVNEVLGSEDLDAVADGVIVTISEIPQIASYEDKTSSGNNDGEMNFPGDNNNGDEGMKFPGDNDDGDEDSSADQD